VLVASGVALAAVVAGALALSGSGDDGKPTPTPMPFKPHQVADIHVGGRPNSIAIGSGLVLATGFGSKRVHLVDPRTNKLRREQPAVGVGGRDVTTGLGAAWVAVSRQQAVFELDPATGRLRARIDVPGNPQTVATGDGAVWVGLTSGDSAVPDSMIRVDPRTRRVTGTYRVPGGVHALVATPSGIWILHRTEPAVSRFDPDTGKITKRIGVGQSPPGDAAYDRGVLWVTSPQEDTISRIDDRSGAKVSSGVDRRPSGIAARGDQIWVTSLIDHTVRRIDPKTSRPVGDRVEVELNPYALAITGDSLWLTAIGRGEIVRVQYRG
jgi:streptogramin lyase